MTIRKENFAETHYYEELGGLKNRMGTFEVALRDLIAKVDNIATAVTNKRSFEPVQVLTFIVLLVGLIGSLTMGIMYIVNATNSGRIAVLEFQVNEMWKAGRWAPGVTTVAKATPREDKQP